MSSEWRDGRMLHDATPSERLAPGWGVFSTVGCDGGRPFLWPWHHERLSASVARLGGGEAVRLPSSADLCELLEAEGLRGPARLRVVVRARVDRGWSVVATAVGLEESGPDQAPVHLALERWPGVPALAGHKSLGRDKWDLARERAVSNGADDALLVDAGGRVLETSIANIWIRRGERLQTPPAPECCLPGVMRRWLIENAAKLGCAFREHELGVDDVAAADEVLVSNAVAGFRKVWRIVDRRWSAWPFFDRLCAAGVPAPGWTQASR